MAGPTYDINELKRRMQGAISVLKQELGGLRTGRASAGLLEPVQVDAYGTTIEISAYYIFLAPKLFELAGDPFNTIKAGIGLRKDDQELNKALAQAFADMRADGTYKKILAKWGLEKLDLD